MFTADAYDLYTCDTRLYACDTLVVYTGDTYGDGGGGFFLACEDWGGKVIHSPPALFSLSFDQLAHTDTTF